jgi:preprotein translocase subunit SecA
MLKLGMEEGVPIEHGMVTRAIANAQKKVEAHNFEIRKQLLEYDDVMNKQREVIYQHRHAVLAGEHIQEDIQDMIRDVVATLVDTYCPADQYSEEWDFNGLGESLQSQFNIDITHGHGTVAEHFKDVGRDAVIEDIQKQVHQAYELKEQELGQELMRYLEKMLLLQVIDHHWKDHLLGMDHLRDGIGLRGYGQKDPLIEYKREGFDMFSAMMDRIKSDVLERLFRVQAVRGEQPPPPPEPTPLPRMVLNRSDEPAPQAAQRPSDKVGRNDPCPCGSGKKYKKCHGA